MPRLDFYLSIRTQWRTGESLELHLPELSPRRSEGDLCGNQEEKPGRGTVGNRRNRNSRNDYCHRFCSKLEIFSLLLAILLFGALLHVPEWLFSPLRGQSRQADRLGRQFLS